MSAQSECLRSLADLALILVQQSLCHWCLSWFIPYRTARLGHKLPIWQSLGCGVPIQCPRSWLSEMSFASKCCPVFSKTWIQSSLDFPIQYSSSLSKSTNEWFAKQGSVGWIVTVFACPKAQMNWFWGFGIFSYALFHTSCWSPNSPVNLWSVPLSFAMSFMGTFYAPCMH